MAKIAYLSRQALVTQGSGSAVSSGTDFGVKNVSGFTRITGLASVIGSMSIRMRAGISETGPFIVTSTWTVNSGFSTMDAPNYGSCLSIDITATVSQSPTFQIFGDPVR